MRSIPLDPVFFRGVVAFDRVAQGLRFSRLPASARNRDPDPQLVLTADMAAAIRLAITTDARTLELDAEAIGLRYVGGARRPVVFDLYVDQTLFARREVTQGPTRVVDFGQWPPKFTLDPGEVTSLRFEGLPAGTKQLELWMPQNAAITIHDLRVDAGAHAEPSPAGRPRWLHYGSSISHGKEAHGPADTWPAIVARQAGLDLTSYAYSGNCLLEGFIAQALAQDDAADVITLEIGINIITSDAMRERAFVPAVHNFLDIIRDRRPDVPVLVISPVFSGVFETQPGPALRTPNGIASIARPSELADGALSATLVRDLLESLVARRRAQGDRRLDYADGRNLFGAGDASHLVDGLHPGAHGHRLMGQRAAAMVEAFWHSAR